MQGFSSNETPLYPGTLFGSRHFDITGGSIFVRKEMPPNFLSGVMYSDIWYPGDNQAVCHAWGAVASDHQVAMKNCSCGFYAYFSNQEHSFDTSRFIRAVVEAWGRVTVGDKGFRAAKAKIVAVTMPQYPRGFLERLAHRIECPAPFGAVHAWGYSRPDPQCTIPYFSGPRGMLSEVAKNYPDVQVFPSAQEMYEAFPPTPRAVAEEILGLS